MNKLAYLFIVLLLSSCLVQSPKYTLIENVMELKIGMTKEEVETKLDLKPYDLKSRTDSSNVFIYIYRVHNRETVSFWTRHKNGAKVLGKHVQLNVAYSLDNKVTSIESCTNCPDNLVVRSKIDFGKIFSFITVSVPLILVYIGVSQ